MSQQESSLTVELPDGSTLDVPEGSTVEDVAYEIGPGLGDDTVAGVLDGDLVAKEAPVYDGATIEIVTPSADEYLEVLRHSAAHVFAQALQRLYPDAKLTIGPWTDDGFYYDITGVDIDEDDLDDIDEEAHEIIAEDLPIERVLVDRADARERYADNPYKLDIIEEEAAGEDPISFYVQDDWQDLCKGPHVESTGQIGASTLLQISSAYWRASSSFVAILMPPAFPRPPTCTCALIAAGKPMSATASTTSSTVVARRDSGTGTPASAKTSFA